MKIQPYADNAKKHPKSQIEQIAKSIERFGMNQPIVVDGEGIIIVGHGRYAALQHLGWEIKPEWVLQLNNLTRDEANAYRLADNKLNESEWDMDLVIEELRGLDADLFLLTGFDADLLLEPEEADDAVPETPEEPRSKLGDLYELGKHRVLCGDSTKLEDVDRLMDGKKADISFTSPPYNVGHNLGYKGKESKYIHEDNKTDYLDLIVKTTEFSINNAKDVFVNLQFLSGNKKELLLWLAETADTFKDIFFWKKSTVQPAMAENVANSQVEVIILFGRDSNRRWGNKKFRGTFSNHIETNSASGENQNHKIHNATYPVALPFSFLKEGYSTSSLVLDLFAGTGTTLIAAEKLSMIANLLELEPKYVDVIVQRYVDYVDNPTVVLNGKEIVWEKTQK